MKHITETQLSILLSELFDIKSPLSADADLTTIIKDSIDLGELLAALYEKHGLRINPNSFRNVYTLDQALSVINKGGK